MDFSPKRPAESEVFTFDFTDLLGTNETLISATVASKVVNGTDAAYASMISGAAQISGKKVLQKIAAGVAGVYYELACTATTDTGQIMIVAGNLSVIS